MILFISIAILNWFNWKTLKTENFTVFYKTGYEWEAWQALQNLEYYREKVVDLTGNRPGRTAIVIEDIGTMANGFANPVFRDIHLFIYPPAGGELDMTENWYRAVGIHEYTHLAHMRKTAGVMRFLSQTFGTIFQPNSYSPGWVIEGITVYTESQLSPYEGRLNDGFFDAYIACCADQGKLPSLGKATYTPLEFPYYAGSYLFGGGFFEYLALKYGEDKFAQFFKTYGSCCMAPHLAVLFPITGIDAASYLVYGRSMVTLFNEWEKYEIMRYQGWKIEGRQLTRRGWYCRYLLSDGKHLYYVREYPKKTDARSIFYFSKIVAYDLKTGKEKVVADLTSSVSTPLKIRDGWLYYTTRELRYGYANLAQIGCGFESNLYRRNL
ncbi:MAG: hypothetical protein ABIL05_01535, partial [candidate division WOR-3 bacterium]